MRKIKLDDGTLVSGVPAHACQEVQEQPIGVTRQQSQAEVETATDSREPEAKRRREVAQGIVVKFVLDEYTHMVRKQREDTLFKINLIIIQWMRDFE